MDPAPSPHLPGHGERGLLARRPVWLDADQRDDGVEGELVQGTEQDEEVPVS
jgi:hypothetical protein